MTTDYCDILRPAAEAALRPLADAVLEKAKELGAAQKRLAGERERAKGMESDFAALKAGAGTRLMGGQNTYEHFRRNIGKRQALLTAAQEIIQTFTAEIAPQAEAALAEAKRKLQAGFLDFVVASRPACEAPMTALIGQALTERDEFMRALDELATFYGTNFTGNARTYPEATHLRPDPYRHWMAIGTGLDERAVDPATVQRRRGDGLTPPPAPEPLPEAPQAPQVPLGERGPSDEAQESNLDARAPEVAFNTPSDGAAENVEGAAPEPLRDTVGLAAGLADLEAEADAEAPPAPTPSE